jgi:hypothetical protein
LTPWKKTLVVVPHFSLSRLARLAQPERRVPKVRLVVRRECREPLETVDSKAHKEKEASKGLPELTRRFPDLKVLPEQTVRMACRAFVASKEIWVRLVLIRLCPDRKASKGALDKSAHRETKASSEVKEIRETWVFKVRLLPEHKEQPDSKAFREKLGSVAFRERLAILDSKAVRAIPDFAASKEKLVSAVFRGFEEIRGSVDSKATLAILGLQESDFRDIAEKLAYREYKARMGNLSLVPKVRLVLSEDLVRRDFKVGKARSHRVPQDLDFRGLKVMLERRASLEQLELMR